jgi:hypothetical protein
VPGVTDTIKKLSRANQLAAIILVLPVPLLRVLIVSSVFPDITGELKFKKIKIIKFFKSLLIYF